MAIEIVDLPTENGDVPVRYVNVYQRVTSGKHKLARCSNNSILGVLSKMKDIYTYKVINNVFEQNYGTLGFQICDPISGEFMWSPMFT